MSADIFAYLALRTGFVVLEQNIFSWGGGENYAKDIDCLSLCQKVRYPGKAGGLNGEPLKAVCSGGLSRK
jgi:hypothetical protein